MIIKFEPIALTKVWGGEFLSKFYHIPQDNIGEIWGISAHSTHSNKIRSETINGITFRDLYRYHRDLFGNLQLEEFPLLFKIIDAADHLSVQVHPDDDYAKVNENSYGKDECWFILGTSSNETDILIGHHATTKKELMDSLLSSQPEVIYQYHPIKVNDYFYIPSGKIHAIRKGTTLLEVSQSSDITYRLYDYNRLDNGKLRPLHTEKSLDVVTVPDTPLLKNHQPKYFDFKVIDGDVITKEADLYGDYLYILDGQGYINNVKVESGDFVMVSSNFQYSTHGINRYILVNIT